MFDHGLHSSKLQEHIVRAKDLFHQVLDFRTDQPGSVEPMASASVSKIHSRLRQVKVVCGPLPTAHPSVPTEALVLIEDLDLMGRSTHPELFSVCRQGAE